MDCSAGSDMSRKPGIWVNEPSIGFVWPVALAGVNRTIMDAFCQIEFLITQIPQMQGGQERLTGLV